MSVANEILLKVENLHVSYGSIHAVKGVSFEVRRGEIVSLIGANGAGKSTTLRALSGLLPKKGTVLFAGEDVSKSLPHALIPKGLIHAPEGRGIFPNLTVLENLELGAYTRKDHSLIKNDFQRCFELFPRMKERVAQLAGTLSGGEQQMLAISRAIMARPKLLMLDEPSLGLAPRIAQQIFATISQLNSEGMTLLLVEQNARMALKIAHRAYVLETGTFKLSGRGLDLLNNPEVQQCYLGA